MHENAHHASDQLAAETAEAGQPVTHVLVLPDRDSATEVAEELGDSEDLDHEPELVREALAGEDDAEDAQWLVVVQDTHGKLDPRALDELAAGHQGWWESA